MDLKCHICPPPALPAPCEACTIPWQQNISNRLLWFQLYPSFMDVMAVRLNFWYKRQEDVSPLLRALWCLTDKLLMAYPCSSDPLSCHSVLSAICSQGASPDPFPLTSHPMPHAQSHDNLHLTLKMPLYIPPMDRSFLSPILPVKRFLLF